MAILLSSLLFAVLMLAIGYFGYRLYRHVREDLQQLGGDGGPFVTPGSIAKSETGDGMVVRIIQELGEKVPIDPTDASSASPGSDGGGLTAQKMPFSTIRPGG